MAKLLLKEIPILPSAFKLDIIICSSVETIANFANKRYGATVDYYRESISLNSCNQLNSTDASELKGHTRTVVILRRKSLDVMAHELIHALWFLASNIGYEMTYESQEWQAVLYEYMLREAMKSDYVQV